MKIINIPQCLDEVLNYCIELLHCRCNNFVNFTMSIYTLAMMMIMLIVMKMMMMTMIMSIPQRVGGVCNNSVNLHFGVGQERIPD